MIMNNRTLILICDQYPHSAGEFFIDDEMRVIAPKFDKVMIYTASANTGKNLNRFVPDNAEVISFSRTKLEASKLKSVFRIFMPMFISEFFFAMKKLSLKYWFCAFKIMYVDIHRATNLKKELVDLCKAKNIDMSDCLFYSYWHDYKALSLAMMRGKNTKIKCIARAHGGDNFRNRFIPPYLPFKRFIISYLDCTFTISNKGKTEFCQYNCRNEKVKVSHLGKLNSRLPVFEKKDSNKVIIVSCSSLILDKRVDLIIEVISSLKRVDIEWHHFGNGELADYIISYARERLVNVKYRFWGEVENNIILDFYANNYVDLFINLSMWEGIPVSIMEALSSGIPVLATDVGGTSEAVNDKIGFLVPANFECSKVSTIINNYLNMPAVEQKRYRQRAYQFWKENYEAGVNFREFCDFLNNL